MRIINFARKDTQDFGVPTRGVLPKHENCQKPDFNSLDATASGDVYVRQTGGLRTSKRTCVPRGSRTRKTTKVEVHVGSGDTPKVKRPRRDPEDPDVGNRHSTVAIRDMGPHKDVDVAVTQLGKPHQ